MTLARTAGGLLSREKGHGPRLTVQRTHRPEKSQVHSPWISRGTSPSLWLQCSVSGLRLGCSKMLDTELVFLSISTWLKICSCSQESLFPVWAFTPKYLTWVINPCQQTTTGSHLNLLVLQPPLVLFLRCVPHIFYPLRERSRFSVQSSTHPA